MHSKQVSDNPKTDVIVLDTGDELLSSLRVLPKRNASPVVALKRLEP